MLYRRFLAVTIVSIIYFILANLNKHSRKASQLGKHEAVLYVKLQTCTCCVLEKIGKNVFFSLVGEESVADGLWSKLNIVVSCSFTWLKINLGTRNVLNQ